MKKKNKISTTLRLVISYIAYLCIAAILFSLLVTLNALTETLSSAAGNSFVLVVLLPLLAVGAIQVLILIDNLRLLNDINSNNPVSTRGEVYLFSLVASGFVAYFAFFSATPTVIVNKARGFSIIVLIVSALLLYLRNWFYNKTH